MERLNKIILKLFPIIVVVIFINLFIPPTRWLSIRFGLWIISVIFLLLIFPDILSAFRKERPKIIPYWIVNFYGILAISFIASTIIIFVYNISIDKSDWHIVSKLILASLTASIIYLIFLYFRKIDDKNKVWLKDLLLNFSVGVIVSFFVAIYSLTSLNDNFLIFGLILIISSYKVYRYFRRHL